MSAGDRSLAVAPTVATTFGAGGSGGHWERDHDMFLISSVVLTDLFILELGQSSIRPSQPLAIVTSNVLTQIEAWHS